MHPVARPAFNSRVTNTQAHEENWERRAFGGAMIWVEGWIRAFPVLLAPGMEQIISSAIRVPHHVQCRCRQYVAAAIVRCCA